jgi:hypothetical protein
MGEMDIAFGIPETVTASIASQVIATLISSAIISNHNKKKKQKRSKKGKREVTVHRTYITRVKKIIRDKL